MLTKLYFLWTPACTQLHSTFKVGLQYEGKACIRVTNNISSSLSAARRHKISFWILENFSIYLRIPLEYAYTLQQKSLSSTIHDMYEM